MTDIVIPHNGIEWNVEVLPFDNELWTGGIFITKATEELAEDTPDLLEQWTRAITGHVLSHHPAKYGWRRFPELHKDADFETITITYVLRCRVFWSKETAEVAQLIGISHDGELWPRAMSIGQMIDAQRGSLVSPDLLGEDPERWTPEQCKAIAEGLQAEPPLLEEVVAPKGEHGPVPDWFRKMWGDFMQTDEAKRNYGGDDG